MRSVKRERRSLGWESSAGRQREHAETHAQLAVVRAAGARNAAELDRERRRVITPRTDRRGSARRSLSARTPRLRPRVERVRQTLECKVSEDAHTRRLWPRSGAAVRPMREAQLNARNATTELRRAAEQADLRLSSLSRAKIRPKRAPGKPPRRWHSRASPGLRDDLPERQGQNRATRGGPRPRRAHVDTQAESGLQAGVRERDEAAQRLDAARLAECRLQAAR